MRRQKLTDDALVEILRDLMQPPIEQIVLAGKQAYDRIVSGCDTFEGEPWSAKLFGMPLMVVDWMPKEKYLLGNRETIEIILGVAKIFGQETALKLVDSLCEKTEEKNG